MSDDATHVHLSRAQAALKEAVGHIQLAGRSIREPYRGPIAAALADLTHTEGQLKNIRKVLASTEPTRSLLRDAAGGGR